MKRWYWRRRQLGTFVVGDGVTDDTRAAVEGFYFDTLAMLEPVFARRSFVLGERPTEADFGFFAPLFRHFFCDPAPARIMRERAPGVQEWAARMWNLRPERFASAPLPERVPDDLGPLFDAVTSIYLPYLDANAAAYAKHETGVCYEVRGTVFTEPVKPYRVWCRDRLQRRFVELDGQVRATLQRTVGPGLERLGVPSPRPVDMVIDALPLTAPVEKKPVDSWWRA
jgi:Glutathione S-transferase, C-terminal domain